MTATAALKQPPTTMTPSASNVEYVVGHTGKGVTSPPQFKKHKMLPHPGKERRAGAYDHLESSTKKYDLTIDTALSKKYRSQPASPRALKHQARRIGGGPDLPPTPPAHSRNSSSSHSAIPSSPTYIGTPGRSTEDIQARPPTTPTNQRSPPTPDVTPPQPERRPLALRPVVHERLPSKSTTASRTESFKTARENPEESDQDDGQSTLRPIMPSPRTSQNTVRPVNGEERTKSKAVGLGLGLESSPEVPTPRAKREFLSFDGEWGSDLEVEQEWDDNLMRNVTVRKRRPNAPTNGHKTEVIEDVTISPSNATKAVRAMPLHGRILAYPSPKDMAEPIRRFTEPINPAASIITDARRSSGMSSKSTVSTVVEAILVDTPPGPPRRQKTLRHIKKLDVLRDSGSDISHSSSAPTSLTFEDTLRRRHLNDRLGDSRYNSVASSGTNNSISSRKARREVWKSGGIPVVVVPDRQSSKKSSKEPSLRSTSSRRSKRSQSVSSAPLSQIPGGKDLAPYFERPSRRGRAVSESDGSASGDQRTMDYPPAIPLRKSSLSAPTSRNPSRAGSLTAESLKAHNALLGAEQSRSKPPAPEVKVEPALSIQSPNSEGEAIKDTGQPNHHHAHKLSVDTQGDPLFGNRLTAQVTPFSQYSVDTNATSAAEISEAMAVSISQHQNRSVLMVDHKPSESSDGEQRGRSTGRGMDKVSSQTEVEAKADRPTITTTDTDAPGPVTPTQPDLSMEDVDSPLRNPRAPPEPPALQFIPATPSGLTPAQEKDKQLGNFYEEIDPKPSRSVSLVRRALSKRRHSESGPPVRNLNFLTRTLSLSKNIPRETAENPEHINGRATARDSFEGGPADETRLHPFWRPAYASRLDDDDGVYDMPDEEPSPYPLIDNRPRPPRRSFSARLKRTFAILPVDGKDDSFIGNAHDTPERRTIRRTDSGNLRVTRRSGSTPDSLRHVRFAKTGPYVIADGRAAGRRRNFWRPRGFANDGDGGRLPSLGGKLEWYGLNNLARRLSERRREKRSEELRQKISGPREVRDGVGDVIRRNSYRGGFSRPQPVA